MFGSMSKKNVNCQQQAINTLQSIFPALNFTDLSKNSSLWDVVEKSAQKLQRPSIGDVNFTINNMKSVVDSQQLKIQKNMIQIQEYEQTVLKKQTSAPIYRDQQNYNHMNTYEHRSQKKHQFNSDSMLNNSINSLNYLHNNNNNIHRSSSNNSPYGNDDILGNFQFIENENNNKDQYFDQYFYNQNHSSTNNYDEKQVQRYLNFDF